MNVISICLLLNVVFSVDIKLLSDEKVDPLFHVGGNSANIDVLVPSDGMLANVVASNPSLKSSEMPDFLSQMSIDLSKVNSNSSGISSFLSQLSKIDPKKVKPIVQLLRGLVIHINDEIKAFKSTLDQAKGELDKAIVVHKDKKSKSDATAAALKQATTSYETSKTNLNNAKIAKGVAETKYNDAKTAYETSVTELATATTINNKAALKHKAAVTAHDTSQKELGDATKVKNAAEVKHNDAKIAYETNKPGLLKNIVIIEEIIAKLEQMSFNLVRHISSKATTNKAYWQTVCDKYGNVTVNSVMKIKMGNYIDYFKPIKTMSFCHFLLSQKSFSWSTKPLGPYIEPKYYVRGDHYGGAENAWSKANAGGRNYLPFWGKEGNGYGGCCVGKAGQSSWYLSFDMYLSKGYFGFLPSFALVRIVGARATTNKASWNAVCGKYGDVTVNSVMRIKMGTYIDYFKPLKTMSFCNFLLTQYSFQWSAKPSGPYVRPKYFSDSNYYGGAEHVWSKANAGGRSYLPFWGREGNAHGGCCDGSAGRGRWFQSFEMHLSKTYIK